MSPKQFTARIAIAGKWAAVVMAAVMAATGNWGDAFTFCAAAALGFHSTRGTSWKTGGQQ